VEEVNQNEQKKIISSYKWIRDLPFEAGVIGGGYSEELEYIKTYKRGSCSAKHYLLGYVCEELEIPVTYLTYPFYWNELNIDYPNFIGKLVGKMPLQYHLAIKINTDEGEFFLDATWNLPLEKVGFPVNKIGDRIANTKNAIIPAGEPIVHSNALERSRWIKELIAGMESTGVEREFYNALNQWLKEIRKM